jgi:hypothetical protein
MLVQITNLFKLIDVRDIFHDSGQDGDEHTAERNANAASGRQHSIMQQQTAQSKVTQQPSGSSIRT